MKEITKEWLKSLNPCTDGFKWWIKHGERNPVKFLEAGFEGDHWNYRCWLMTRLLSNKNQVKLAIYSAKLVLPLFEKKYTDDDRPRKAITAADAADAARAARAARAAADAAYAADAAADAADAAADAAYAAAAYAARAAAYDENSNIVIKQILEYAIKLLKG